MLIKEDIEKKKEALQEEMNLIDERLRKRKEAEDQASKYQQLVEYRNQLAMIEMDPTRTKDAAELRKKISELQKEHSWDIAESFAENQKEEIQDQIDAYDQFITEGDKALEAYLGDANNFVDEISQLLGKEHEELIQWLKDNDEDYKKSLENTQQTIVQSWTDTWEQMRGIVHTYWDEINNILSSEESFVDYMMQSSSYKNASEDEKKQMEYNWRNMYQMWVKAQDTSAEFSHNDDEYNSNGTTSGSGSGGSGGDSNKVKEDHGYQFTWYSANGRISSRSDHGFSSKEEAMNAAIASINSNQKAEISNLSGQPGTSIYDYEYNNVINRHKQMKSTIKAYKYGGLVDYTGLAWVDGAPGLPEGFLDSDDTKMLQNLVNALNYISTPRLSYYQFEDKQNGSIGNLNIEINGAQFENDADYELIAKRVGEELTRELEKQGFTTAKYMF